MVQLLFVGRGRAKNNEKQVWLLVSDLFPLQNLFYNSIAFWITCLSTGRTLVLIALYVSFRFKFNHLTFSFTPMNKNSWNPRLYMYSSVLTQLDILKLLLLGVESLNLYEKARLSPVTALYVFKNVLLKF